MCFNQCRVLAENPHAHWLRGESSDTFQRAAGQGPPEDTARSGRAGATHSHDQDGQNPDGPNILCERDVWLLFAKSGQALSAGQVAGYAACGEGGGCQPPGTPFLYGTPLIGLPVLYGMPFLYGTPLSVVCRALPL